MSFLFLFLMSTAHVRAAGNFVSGEYGDLRLAFNPHTQELSGIYEKSIDENPECRFAFSGLLKNHVAQIQTYTISQEKDELTGALSMTKDGALRLILSAEPKTCHGAPFLSEKRKPAIFKLQHRKPRLYLRVLENPQATLYSAPDASKGIPQKWQRGEVFEVIDTRVGWLKIPRLSEGDYSWLQESNFYPLFEGDTRDQRKTGVAE